MNLAVERFAFVSFAAAAMLIPSPACSAADAAPRGPNSASGIIVLYGGGPMPDRVAELVNNPSDATLLSATLPGTVVLRDYDEHTDLPQLSAAVARAPKCFGIGIAPATALVRDGRTLRVVGNGTVVILLPKSAARPELAIRLREHMTDDFTALRRATIARAGEPFPPPQLAAPRVPQGSLLLVGGGAMPQEVRNRFIELAGGPKAKIVVVPTASENPTGDESDLGWLKDAGAAEVVVLHARTLDEANSPELLAKLKDATGVWFGGGRQWRFVDAYEGTKCYGAFHDVLRRGGVIGGSSAGATIQGEYLVRGSPLRNTIMMAEGYERGFSFLPGTAVDQHFTQRKREPDMQALKRTHPQLLGLGIDEGTAAVVRGTTLEVLGENGVSIYRPTKAPADDNGPRAAVLRSGERYDLKTFRQAP